MFYCAKKYIVANTKQTNGLHIRLFALINTDDHNCYDYLATTNI